jgi:hypothetical protein
MQKNVTEKVQYLIKLKSIYYLFDKIFLLMVNVHVDPIPTDAVHNKFTSWIRILSSDYGSADPEELILSRYHIRTQQPSC